MSKRNQKMQIRLIGTMVCMAFAISSSNVLASQQSFSLERYSLNSLRIWYVAMRSAYPFAYVIDPDGYAHHVEIGEAIGNHFGLVKEIDECGVWVKELYQDEKQE